MKINTEHRNAAHYRVISHRLCTCEYGYTPHRAIDLSIWTSGLHNSLNITITKVGTPLMFINGDDSVYPIDVHL